MTDASEKNADRIAVIGMSCRFPGSPTVDRYWQTLRDGQEAITRFTAGQLAEAGVDPAMLDQPGYVNARGILGDIDLFDAAFFGFSPRETEILDPQQRFFLECAWEALENAGYDPEAYPGLIGIFGGVGFSKYLFNLYANPEVVSLLGPYQISLANDKDHLTTRAAYKLNLKGPAVTVQTACSTSLVAVVMACQSLLDYQCDMALAGGSSIDLPQTMGYFYQEGGIASPDGHCRAFDAAAQGTVGGNGAGVVLLKRLEDALADGDPIDAVILGSAINNDGSVKVGYTAPSIEGQATAITMALSAADVPAESITYVETHGTGTPLGDPIEMAALTQVFQAGRARRGSCAVGSVKTNIGHLDAAAGVAGLIKTVLALKHRQIPPSLHFQAPNPKIDFASSPFYVNTRLADWQPHGTPRRAGVSSFGIGGTNAHVVLEEAPQPEPRGLSGRARQLLVISARSQAALSRLAVDWADYLRANPQLDLADAAYTAQVGRRGFDHRLALVCSDLSDAIRQLDGLAAGRRLGSVREKTTPPAVFLFPGQGAQFVNMARPVYETEPVFREVLDECAERLAGPLGLDLRTVMFPPAGGEADAEQRLQQTAVTQPALFAVEYALARQLMAWGIQPEAMIGHSIGEYVAACLAGVFSLPDALTLVAARGQLMQAMPGGLMLAVSQPAGEVLPLLDAALSIAVINTPGECVVSGPTGAVESLEARLAANGITCRRLHTSHAFHSAMMEPVLNEFMRRVQTVALHPPDIPFISNVTGTWITREQATDPQYWTGHIRQTVNFAAGAAQLLREPNRVLVEVGPGRTLSGYVQQHPAYDAHRLVLPTLRHPRDAQPDDARLLQALGQLWERGLPVDWEAFHTGEVLRRLHLPTYPFERQRYWVDAPHLAAAGQPGLAAATDRRDFEQWFYIPTWQKAQLPPGGDASPRREPDWLVFTNATPLNARLIDRLQRQSDCVITVVAGERFVRIDDRQYAINPSQPEDYAALLRELHLAQNLPAHILHGWGLTPDDGSLEPGEQVEAQLQEGFFSLVYLAQAVGTLGGAQTFQVVVLTNGAQSVMGDEPVLPAKAAGMGACRVIAQEYAQVRCRSIDLPLPETGSAREASLVHQVLAELAGESSDLLAAYRGGERWVPRLEPVHLASDETDKISIRENGVYLITGGLGGIGLVLAEHLAKTGPVKLVLTGRTVMPDRSDWPDWLANHTGEDQTAEKIRKIQAIEMSGAEVLAVTADVTDSGQMQALLDQVTARFGPVNGVIHAAGTAGGGIIQLKTRAEALRVMAPKITGTLVLDALLGNTPLDFFVLCSSLASIVGGLGQVDYCAANVFMDAFAQAAANRRRSGVIAINWDRWQEVGMAVKTAAPPDLVRGRSDWPGLRPSEGAAVFDRALQKDWPQVIVSTLDITRLTAPDGGQAGAGATRAETPAVGLRTGLAEQSRPDLTTPYLAADQPGEAAIVAIFEALLGIKPVGVNDSFFELGGHSLLAIQLVSRLREQFKVELPMQTVFDAPTAAELAKTVDTLAWATQMGSTPASQPDGDYEEGEL